MDEPKPTDDISEVLAQRRWRQLLMVSDDVLLQIADQFRDGSEEALVTFDRADPLDLTRVSRAEFDRLVAERPVSVPQVATTDMANQQAAAAAQRAIVQMRYGQAAAAAKEAAAAVRFRLPSALKAAVQAVADLDGRSMNGMLVELVRGGLEVWADKEHVERMTLTQACEAAKAEMLASVDETDLFWGPPGPVTSRMTRTAAAARAYADAHAKLQAHVDAVRLICEVSPCVALAVNRRAAVQRMCDMKEMAAMASSTWPIEPKAPRPPTAEEAEMLAEPDPEA
jgi:hypothetical protein